MRELCAETAFFEPPPRFDRGDAGCGRDRRSLAAERPAEVNDGEASAWSELDDGDEEEEAVIDD